MFIIMISMMIIMMVIPSLINPHTYSRAVQLAATLGSRYLDYDRCRYNNTEHQYDVGSSSYIIIMLD